MSDISIEQYRSHAERLWDLNSSEVFSNSQGIHAAVILETFLKKARSYVAIFCKNLSSEVYDTPSMRTAMLSALRRGVRIEIICQEEPESKSLLETMKRWRTMSYQILVYCGEACKKLRAITSNFAVADWRAYRFEENNSEHRAFACMNNPELGKSLMTAFTSFLSLASSMA